jgi:hypothetical protein
MKVAILSLAFNTRALEYVILIKKPKVCHVIAPKDGLSRVAKEHGYTKSNRNVLCDVGAKVGCKMQFYTCDLYDPWSISNAIGKILTKIDIEDEIMINYSAGSRSMSLMLGALAVVLARLVKVKVIYSALTPSGEEKIFEHTEPLVDFFKSLQRILPNME